MRPQKQSPKRVWPTTRITLLEQIADKQNQASWTQFVRLYAPLIQQYCRRRGLQESDACDVAQDVLLKLSKRMGTFRYEPTRGRFRSWLGTITHRTMLRYIDDKRRPHRFAAGGEESLGEWSVCPEPRDGHWVEAFNAHVYREAVKRSRPDFDALTWHAFERTFTLELSPKEVAIELNRTVGWVYQAKSKVIRRLREEILYLAEDSVLLNYPSRL